MLEPPNATELLKPNDQQMQTTAQPVHDASVRIESSAESEAERQQEEDEDDYEEAYEWPPSSPAHVKIIKASARFVKEADGLEEQAQAQRERGGSGVYHSM